MSFASRRMMAATAVVLAALGMSGGTAWADTGDFQVTSMTVSPSPAPTGSTVDVTVNVTEKTADVGGGENHQHSLPLTILFDWSSGSHKGTVTGVMQSADPQPDQQGSMFSGVYSVTLPNLSVHNQDGKTLTLTTAEGTVMAYPNGKSPDSDDPISGSASLTVMPPPAPGQMPEVPLAGALPLALAGIGGVVWAARRKAARRQD